MIDVDKVFASKEERTMLRKETNKLSGANV